MKRILVLLALSGCGSSPNVGGDDDLPDATVGQQDASTDASGTEAPDAAPVCTADILNDPDNCGACGRSCLGSQGGTDITCEMGQCFAYPLTPAGFYKIGDFATDGLFIYYTGFDPTAASSPHRLWKFAIGVGTAATYIGAFTHPDPIRQIAVDGDYFYMADPGRYATGNNGVIRQMHKEPFSWGNLIQSLEPTTTAILVQNGYVYWATDSDGANGGDIKRIPITGGTVSTLSAGTGRVVYLAADTSNFFWVDDSSYLRRAPIAGGAPVTIISGKADFFDMDATNIYMVRQNTGEVISVPKIGGAATVLGTGMTGGGAIDDEYVYVAQNNKLMAVTKTGAPAGTLWERANEGSDACPTTFKVTRVKVIGDYVYFLSVPRTCTGVEIWNQIYRVARM